MYFHFQIQKCFLTWSISKSNFSNIWSQNLFPKIYQFKIGCPTRKFRINLISVWFGKLPNTQSNLHTEIFDQTSAYLLYYFILSPSQIFENPLYFENVKWPLSRNQGDCMNHVSSCLIIEPKILDFVYAWEHLGAYNWNGIHTNPPFHRYTMF